MSPAKKTIRSLWCSEFMAESPSTSEDSGRSSQSRTAFSGCMSAERRRFTRISLADSSRCVFSSRENLLDAHRSRQMQHQQHQQPVHQITHHLQLPRRSLCLDTESSRIGLARSLSVSSNDVSSSSAVVTKVSRVLEPIDTNCSQNGENSGYQAAVMPTSSHGYQRPSIFGRKRRAPVDEQLNTSQRPFVSADVDKAIHLDRRALTSLLNAERYGLPTTEAFKALQTEIKEVTRRQVIECISEICLQENCDLVVFPLAVSYLDRLLSVQFVPERNLPALASACLFLSSKMKAPKPLTAIQIVHHVNYDYSISLEQLLDWELLVVNKLRWDLSCATAYEFFDQLLVRAPILENIREAFAHTLNAMMRVMKLSTLPPSKQAAVCLLFAADESHKRHLVEESEGVIRQWLKLDAKADGLRTNYATDIRFALQNLFFDEEVGDENKQTPNSCISRSEDEFVIINNPIANITTIIEQDPETSFSSVSTNPEPWPPYQDSALNTGAISPPNEESNPPPFLSDELYLDSRYGGTSWPSPSPKLSNDNGTKPPASVPGSFTYMDEKTNGSTSSSSSTLTVIGNDSGFTSMVSTPDASATTTSLAMSNAPSTSTDYEETKRKHKLYPQHQGFGQLFEL